MNTASRGVWAADGGLLYLLPEGSLLAAYAMVAASSHRRLEACPALQLKVLLTPWNTAGESTNVVPTKSLAGVPVTFMTQVPQFSPRGSFSSTHRTLSLGCMTWDRLVMSLARVRLGHSWPLNPVVPAALPYENPCPTGRL